MIEVAILKNFDSGTYKAGVQLAGSLTTYFDDVSVARNIPSSALVIGNYVILAIPGGNPKDACVIATWPQGGGSFLDLSDTPSGYSGQAGKGLKVNAAENALEFGYKSKAFVEGWTANKLLKGAGAGTPPTETYPQDFLCARGIAFTFLECWKSLDGWTESTVGSGSYSLAIVRLSLFTGTTINSRESFYSGIGFSRPYYYDNHAIFQLVQAATNLTNSTVKLYFVSTGVAVPPSDTDGHIGFKIINGQIWATNADGATETLTDTGESVAAQWSNRQLRLIGTGSSIEFYVNNVLKAIHSTNLPLESEYYIYLGITNDAAINQSVRIYPIVAQR